MFVGKQFDIVLGVDIHIIQPPGPVPPLPIPHPFVGMVFDPMEFVPILGASNMVNGIPRAQAGTTVKATIPHFPIGGTFIKPPSNDGEIFMGSMTVPVEGEPFPSLGSPVLTCQDAGMLPIPRPKRKSKSKPKSMVLPMSVLLPVPKGGMSIAMGILTISLMAIGMKLGMSAFGKFLKKRKASKLSKKIKDGQQGKHIPGHNNYVAGKSTLDSDAQNLLDRVHKGDVKSIDQINPTKARVDFGETIGNYIDEAGKSFPTSKGIIHSGKNGAHIVPARP